MQRRWPGGCVRSAIGSQASRSGAGGTERARLWRWRRGGGSCRHPTGRRRRENRLQSSRAGDHACVGWRRAPRRHRRKEPCSASGRHRSGARRAGGPARGPHRRRGPRDSFEDQWRTLARKLAAAPVTAIKRVIAGATPEEAIDSFAKLWVSDAHWAAAERVMKRPEQPKA